MIPIKAECRYPGRAFAVWAIVIACAAVFIRLASLPQNDAEAIVVALGAVPARFLATPLSPSQVVTVFTSAFLHAGWIHLAGNMLFLIVFGPAVQARLGWVRFLALYVIAGAAGVVAHLLSAPSSTVPLVGASGAIAGVLGAHLVLEPRSRITTIVPIVIFVEVASLPAAFVIGMWFVLQLASAVAPVAHATADNVAWFAHLGGFVAGTLMATPAAAATRGRRGSKGRARAAGTADS